jgi:hypothetical protein
MSHITQRQLHWLCGKITTTGRARIWCDAAVVSSGAERGPEMDMSVLIASLSLAFQPHEHVIA